ncbi:reverse transcriptase domain-containing protein [Tanacetum coccineum]|uniref:Reverse transcriptase domain-containing protein n=1 Tax=Tanacetum coccineum TaxID=301880 RepID=A0ABQ4XB49_9ASTR
MEKLVAELLTFNTLMKGKELIVYLSTADEAVLADFLADTITEVGQAQKEVPVKEDIPELSKAKDTIGERDLALRSDTQVEGSYEGKNEEIQGNVLEITTLFDKFCISHIPRAQNKKTDALSKLAVVQLDHLTKEVLVEVLNERSIDIIEVNMVKIPPRSAAEVRRFVAGKLCDQGDTYGLLRNSRWTKKSGMDIVGSLSEAPRKMKYLIVAIDYFTKWLEAKSVATITGKQVKNFAFNNLVCRFGIPTTIITNSGTQIVNESFKSRAGRKVISTFLYHPQANRAVERANSSLMKGIKTGLCKEGACWVEELLNMLWAHRIIQRQTMEKPYSV